jgi:hypothetical protein
VSFGRELVAGPADLALGQVPVRDIETGSVRHIDVFKKSGDEVEPALFEVYGLGDIVTTVVIKTVLPPVEKNTGRVGFVTPNKPTL